MEVTAAIRFITPSLGDVRGEVRDRFHYDKDGKVIFLQSWFRSMLRFGAQALGRAQKEVDDIQVDPLITGVVKVYKRYYKADAFKEHEAFLAGDEIRINFYLPNSIPIDLFRQILEIAGRYVGVSAYGFRQNFGRFVVVSIEKKLTSV